MTYNVHKIRKALASARAFLNKDKNFESIVNICVLKPKNQDWRIWEDEAGNYLRLQNDRSCHIYSSNTTQIDTKDIYRKSKPNQIMKYSNWALFGFKENECTIWFLGYDGRLRTSFFKNGKWIENRMPLLSGIQILRIISERINILPIKHIKLPFHETGYTMELTDMNFDSMLTKEPRGIDILQKCGYDS